EDVVARFDKVTFPSCLRRRGPRIDVKGSYSTLLYVEDSQFTPVSRVVGGEVDPSIEQRKVSVGFGERRVGSFPNINCVVRIIRRIEDAKFISVRWVVR